MSNLDVQVLKSFTRKLAFAAEKIADANMDAAMVSAMSNPDFYRGLYPQLKAVGSAAMDFGKEPRSNNSAADQSPSNLEPRSNTSAVDQSLANLEDAGGPRRFGRNLLGDSPPQVGDPPESPTSGPSASSIAPAPSPGAGPTAGGLSENASEGAGMSADTMTTSTPSGDELFPGSPTSDAGYQARLPETSQTGVSDPPYGSWQETLMGALPYAGSAAAGGLGAMALARLFNSSKDDEEESSWAPWLTGLAGAGAGLGAYHYSPQIQAMLASLAARAGLGGDPASGAEPPATA